MYCKFCGKKLEDDSKFCSYCGKELQKFVESNNSQKSESQNVIVDAKEEAAIKNEEKPSLRRLWIFIILFVTIFVVLIGVAISATEQDNLFKKNHTITLVVNGLSDDTVTVDNGEVLSVDINPIKENYIFTGWYTNSACTIPYDFSQPVTTSFNLYAGFTLKTKTISLKDIKIKALSSTYDNEKSFSLSFSGFDYEYLEKNGMGLQIKITYNVKYKKEYNVPLDIGYAGSPEYDISLINSYLNGYFAENLSTTTSEVKKYYTYNTALSFSKNQQISLTFSTDNVQNIVILSDIVVVVEAIKLS